MRRLIAQIIATITAIALLVILAAFGYYTNSLLKNTMLYYERITLMAIYSYGLYNICTNYYKLIDRKILNRP